MNIGDLIEWDGKAWVVRKIDTALATAFLESSTGDTAVVSTDFKGAGSLGSPPQDWPAAQLPSKRLGRLVSVSTPTRVLGKLTEWLKLDEFQIGGCLYLNPSLNLGYRDRLVAAYRNPTGKLVSVPIEIPRNFVSATVKEEQARKAALPLPSPPREPTIYDRILEDSDEFL